MELSIISTDRLRISTYKPDEKEDKLLLTRLCVASEEAYLKYIYEIDEVSFEAHIAKKQYSEIRDTLEQWKLFDWFLSNYDNVYLLKKHNENESVGLIGLYTDKNKRPRLTYFILPESRKQGLMTEAYAAVSSALLKRGLDARVAEVLMSNKLSLKFLNAQGFKVTRSVSRMDSIRNSVFEGLNQDYFVLRK